MSEIPPSDPTPPSQFVQYPRETIQLAYGSIEKLEALGEGYFGLGYVFVLNVFILVLMTALDMNHQKDFNVAVPLIILIIAVASYPYNVRIAFGKGWPVWKTLLASTLMGLNSALCCGVVGYIIMQHIAMSEMYRYGLSGSMFGLRKKVFQVRVDALRAAQAKPTATIQDQPEGPQ